MNVNLPYQCISMKFDLSEVSAVIRARRTIYPEQYTDRVVQREMVERMINNAIWAPTHGKTQPWRFKVYSGAGRESLKAIVQNLYETHTPAEKQSPAALGRMLDRIDKTSVLIALVMSRSEEGKIPEIEEVEAVACAAQNLLLTATAYGLGAFWSTPGFLSKPDATAAFGYKADDKVLGLIYLGYPSVEWPESHRKPLEYVTEWVE